MDNLLIRKEVEQDFDHISNVIVSAFKDVIISDHLEHDLVDRLRKSKVHVPELCMVAVDNDQIVGHICL